jgi:hypothetical protein
MFKKSLSKTNKMKNTKLGLISKLLLGATGLLGLAGCEAGPQTSRDSLYSQSGYSEKDDIALPRAILGGMLSAGLGNGLLPTNVDPAARQLASDVLKGTGNGLVEYNRNTAVKSSGAKVQVNINGVNSNGASGAQNYEPPRQVSNELSDKLIPEYDLGALRKEWEYELGYKLFRDDSSGLRAFFTYEKYWDLNGDSKPSFDEFRGIKRNFKKDKTVNFAVQANPPAFSKTRILYQLFNENGKEVCVDMIDDYTKVDLINVYQGKLPELSPGVYTLKLSYYIKATGKRNIVPISEKSTVFQVLE